MANDKKSGGDKPEAQIFRRPINDQATRKVQALPELLKKSERPDGMKAAKVADKEDDDPATLEKVRVEPTDGGLFDDLFGDEDF